MDDHPRVSRLRLLLFALVTAALAAGGFFLLRQPLREAYRARFAERDQRLLQDFQNRLTLRLRAARMRIRGAELLISTTPPSARTAARALAFAMNEESSGSFAAAVVLDERGGVLASRRRSSVPPPGKTEKTFWAQAVGALRVHAQKTARPDGEPYYVQPGILNGIPLIFFAAPSPSTKGFWGLIVESEKLMSIDKKEMGPRDSIFLLTEPDQSILYVRQGEKFLFEAIAGSFEKDLAALLKIPICCDATAFNTVNEKTRWMVQSTFSGGIREMRLVRVSSRLGFGTGLATQEKYVGGGLALGWLVLVGLFFFAGGKAAAPAGEGGPRRSSDDGRASAAGGSPLTVDSGSLAVISKVSGVVAKGDHFRDVIAMIMQEGAQIVDARRYYAALYDEAMDQLLEVCSQQLGETYRGAIAMGTWDLPERIVVREKEIVEVTSLNDWEDAPETMKSEGVQAAAIFPMCAMDKIVGVLSFYFDEPRELTNEEVDYCTLLAQQGSVAIARALSLAEPPPED